jgi:hypothetical protein
VQKYPEGIDVYMGNLLLPQTFKRYTMLEEGKEITTKITLLKQAAILAKTPIFIAFFLTPITLLLRINWRP